MGIAYADGLFYVLDTQNARIQILNENLEYMRQIPFDRRYVEGNVEYGSIAVNKDGDIYFSIIETGGCSLLLYKREEDSFSELGENMIGTVASDSAGYSSVDCYSMEGEYFYSLAVSDGIGMYSSLAEGVDGRFYLADDNGLSILEAKE